MKIDAPTPDEFRALALPLMRELFERSKDLQERMRADLAEWRRRLFKFRLACLFCFGAVMLCSDSARHSANDWLLALNCFALALNICVIFVHFRDFELPWLVFRLTQKKVDEMVRGMGKTIDEIEREGDAGES